MNRQGGHCCTQGVVGAGAQPAESDIANAVATAQEFDRGANVFERHGRKHFILWLTGPFAAVAEAR